ncbi:putative non-specific serine/threonine protein kinase [Helianthus annuus]|nr:putative non-specific serine/threonine protein kinase [Helianthus annuus]
MYSFGVVLAELITGSKPLSMERLQEERNLATYLLIAQSEDRLTEIIDPHVFDEAASYEQLEAACSLACRCLQPSGMNRPSRKEVTIELERIRKIINPWDSEVYGENLND